MQDQTEMEKLLIENVGANECLYNNKIELYKDSHLRALTWKNISKIIGKTAPECKAMWNGLRNAFTHAIARRKLQAEQGKTFNKWKYEEEMSFLFPYVDIRGPKRKRKWRSEENTDESSNEDSQTSSFVTLKKESFVQAEDDPQDDLSDKESHASFYNLSKTNSSATALQQNNQRDNESYGSLQTMDEIDLFFASVVKSVKKLPLVEQVHLKNNIMRLVGEAEIRQAEQNQNMISVSQLGGSGSVADINSLSKNVHKNDPLY